MIETFGPLGLAGFALAVGLGLGVLFWGLAQLAEVLLKHWWKVLAFLFVLGGIGYLLLAITLGYVVISSPADPQPVVVTVVPATVEVQPAENQPATVGVQPTAETSREPIDSRLLILLAISGICLLAVVLALLFFRRPDPTPPGEGYS